MINIIAPHLIAPHDTTTSFIPNFEFSLIFKIIQQVHFMCVYVLRYGSHTGAWAAYPWSPSHSIHQLCFSVPGRV